MGILLRILAPIYLWFRISSLSCTKRLKYSVFKIFFFYSDAFINKLRNSNLWLRCRSILLANLIEICLNILLSTSNLSKTFEALKSKELEFIVFLIAVTNSLLSRRESLNFQLIYLSLKNACSLSCKSVLILPYDL